jgi:photosystem II stability/assembly factor-like uncharacterized protein
LNQLGYILTCTLFIPYTSAITIRKEVDFMSSLRKSIHFLIATVLVFTISACAKDGNINSPTPNAGPTESPIKGNTSLGPLSFSPQQVTMGTITALRLADFQTGWAGGEGWIARTDNGGESWVTQLDHNYIVKQLFALNNKSAWATLDSGNPKSLLLYQTSDGGKTWSEAGTVPNSGYLHFISKKEAFSGNARTTDGGKTWVTLSVPDPIVGDAYFHDRSNGWVVTQGGDKFNFLHTTNGGKSWHYVKSKATVALVTGVVIRSAGKNDAWIELIGGSGMSQTSYSLFHTMDGGKTWLPVLANAGAGSGPAPGYKTDEKTKVPANAGSGPGTLYVVNTKTAFMGGVCMACENSNTMGKTFDGGKTWVNFKAEFPGYGTQQIAAADANHIWWINTDYTAPSVMYKSSDGGKHWSKVHTFDKTNPYK